MTYKREITQDSYQKFDRSVSLICWAYNEEALIGEFLEKATELMDATIQDYEIILIDDASTDKTYEIAESFRMKNNRLIIFRNKHNLNVGLSSQRAIQMASKEYLFWQTIDWSYDISHLREFLNYLKTFDIVQGVRRKPVVVKVKFLKPIVAFLKIFGTKHLVMRSDTVIKAIISVINYVMIRMLFNIPLSDFQNVTFYKTKWIQSIKYEANSSFVNPEGLIKAYWRGLSIKEVQINFIPREKGEAKGTKVRSIINSVKDILRLWFQWVILNKRDYIRKGIIVRNN